MMQLSSILTVFLIAVNGNAHAVQGIRLNAVEVSNNMALVAIPKKVENTESNAGVGLGAAQKKKLEELIIAGEKVKTGEKVIVGEKVEWRERFSFKRGNLKKMRKNGNGLAGASVMANCVVGGLLAVPTAGASVLINGGLALAVSGATALKNKIDRKDDDERKFNLVLKSENENSLRSFEEGLTAILALKQRDGKKSLFKRSKDLKTVFKKINLVWHLKEAEILKKLNAVRQSLRSLNKDSEKFEGKKKITQSFELWNDSEESRDAIILQYTTKVEQASMKIAKDHENGFENDSKILKIMGVDTPRRKSSKFWPWKHTGKQACRYESLEERV